MIKRLKKIIKNSLPYRYYISNLNRKRNSTINYWKSEVKRLDKLRGDVIEKYVPKGGIGAEIGVYKGHFSRVLLNRTNPKELHLIDPWYLLTARWNWGPENRSTVDALSDILQKNKKKIEEKVVFIHINDSVKILDEFPDDYFDWVYIDSTHKYEQTIKELDLSSKKVKASGIICGDDWSPDPNHRHHGVYKAVNEFIVKNDYKLLYANDENLQWFIKKNDE